MKMQRSRDMSRLVSRTRNRSRLRYQLRVELLEERWLLAAPPPIPPLLLPAVTIGLAQEQINQADVVINWNAEMLRAIWTDGTPPTWASRVEAMVGVAVYDAVEGLQGARYTFYPVPGLDPGSASHGASRQAAAVAAADTVLHSLYPDQTSMFDSQYQADLAGIPDGPPKTRGIAWGQTVANAVLAWRASDGSTAISNYQAAPPGGPPGVYELTPSAGQEGPPPPGFEPPLTPQWGQVTTWAMTSFDQFPLPGPPALDSAEYAADFNDVKSLGDTNSTTRTADETQYAHFWADVPGHSVTPPGHWDEIAEHVSLQVGLDLQDNAHLFALVNIGLADAAINCWGFKYVDNFWRPITAIRDPRASQINPATTSDPNWTPLWNTPPFPSYASGHSTFSGAASTILASIFGDNFSFTDGSDDMPGYSRSFTSFTQAANEAGESRVVGGIHFAFDNTDGLAAGRAIGGYVAQNFLLPLHGTSIKGLSATVSGMQGSGSFARGFGVVPVQIIAALSSKVGIELIHMESPNQSRSPTTPDQSSQIAPLQFASAPVQPVGLAATQLMKVRTIEISLDALDRVFAELIAAGRDDGLAMARTRP
jgi:hypothetical protein